MLAGSSPANKDHNINLLPRIDSAYTNHWGEAETTDLELSEIEVFRATPGYAYNHHPQITSLGSQLLATWSSGIYNEDEPGQVMMFSVSNDHGNTWSDPTHIFGKKKGKFNDLVYTAEGIMEYNDTLVAFAGENDYEGLFLVEQDEIFPQPPESGDFHDIVSVPTIGHRTLVKTSTDGGKNWSEETVIVENFIPNLKPYRTSSGRLILPGNMSFPYTDAAPWKPWWNHVAVNGLPEIFVDAPRWFQKTQEEIQSEFKFCEASIMELSDGTLQAFFRTNKKRLALSKSEDNGQSWSAPVLTNFTDCGSRFECGVLPDGRYFILSCPKPKSVRTPLVLATSTDGVVFDRHFVLGDEQATTARTAGRWKYGRYGYPTFHIVNNFLLVIYSVNKEDIRMFRFPLSYLTSS